VSTTFALIAVTATTALSAGIAAGYTLAARRLRRLRRDLSAARHRLTHDPLTGLTNRAALAAYLAGRDTAVPVTVGLVNLDGFAAINASLGYRGSDELLVLYAARLAYAAHTEGGQAFRLAGDEFALVLPTHDTAAAERLLATLPTALDVHTGGHPVAVTVHATVGLADAAPYTRLPLGVLLHRANTALQHAKRHHRGHTHRWTPQLAATPLPRHRGRTRPIPPICGGTP
jgi:diguanylate cyclase (GGDEF)-like protein